MKTRARVLLSSCLLAPLLCSTASGITIVNDGTAVIDSPVNCGAHKGRVVVRTGVHFQEAELDFQDGISSFQATQGNALSCCWVQFAWAEAIATVQSGGAIAQARINGTLPTTGGPVGLSANPATPSWHVDAAGKSPCYESAGLGIKDQRGTTIFDRPGNVAEAVGPVVAGAVAAPATVTQVEATIHFEAYLVCNRTVCYVVRWTVRYTWAPPPGGVGPPTLSGPNYTPVPSGQAGGAIRPEQKLAAGAEHPGQTVLPP